VPAPSGPRLAIASRMASNFGCKTGAASGPWEKMPETPHILES
jgi:hypothetical protein